MWGRSVGVAVCVVLALGACSASGGSRGTPQLRPVGDDSTPQVDSPADPSSAIPCDAISTSDIRSVFGGTIGVGIVDEKNPGTCTWVSAKNGVPTRFAFMWPGTGAHYATKTPNAVATLRAKQAKAAGTEVVSGVGDFAYLDPATTTLYVAKDPNLLFAVKIIPALGSTPTADQLTTEHNQLKVLANEIIATHAR